MALSVERLMKALKRGGIEDRGTQGKGSRRFIGKSQENTFKPKEFKSCLNHVLKKTQPEACEIISTISQEGLLIHTPERRDKLDGMRQIVCTAQDICPVIKHSEL